MSFCQNHSLRHFDGRADLAGRMTTVWRPRVRIDVPNVGDAENTDTSRRGVDQEGHEAEESPEALRAVRARGEASLERARCAVLVRTVVCASMQGVRRVTDMRARSSSAVSARSAVGVQSVSTVVGALCARSAVVHQSASTVVCALSARSAVGHNMRARSSALYMQGVRWGCNLRARSSAL